MGTHDAEPRTGPVELRPRRRRRSERVAEAARLAAEHRAAHQARLSTDAIPLDRAVALTGSSAEHLLRFVRRGDALALEDGGAIRLIPWQLRDNPLSPIVPGIRDVAASFPGDLAALHDWMTRENQSLGGETPATALQAGETLEVLALVRAIGAAGR
jgi:hypothetical protein